MALYAINAIYVIKPININLILTLLYVSYAQRKHTVFVCIFLKKIQSYFVVG